MEIDIFLGILFLLFLNLKNYMRKQFTIFSVIIFFAMIIVSFSLNDEVKATTTCGEAVSYGGLSYDTVQIGTQCWFKQNLNVGAMIMNLEVPDNTAPTLNDPETVSKWCYDDSSANCTSEGGLYAWAEANALSNSCNSTSCSVTTPNQGICPNGWHIPSDEEFFTLENYLKTPEQTCDATRAGWGCSDAGAKLKFGGSSGFDAIGAGNHETNGDLSLFDKREPSAHFWSSSPCLNCSNWGYSYNRALYMSSDSDMVRRGSSHNAHGFSVRCIADFFATPSCTSWTYSDWSTCSSNGQQTRTVISSSPSGCTGGSPVIAQSCIYIPPTCASWTYSDWSACSSDGQQTRTIIYSSPESCSDGSPTLNQSCTFNKPIDPNSISPVISSISPKAITPGDVITISGNGFGDSQGSSNLSIGGYTPYGTILSWTNTQIQYETSAYWDGYSKKVGIKKCKSYYDCQRSEEHTSELQSH